MAGDVSARISRDMSRFSTELRRTPEAAVLAGLRELRTEVGRERDKATGGDGRLSNVGRNGVALGLGVEMRRNPGRAAARGALAARGPWPLVEDSIPAHVITPRRSGARRNLNAASRVLGGAGRAGTRVAGRAGDLSGLGSGRGRGRRSIVIPGVGHRAYARHPGRSASAQPRPFRKGVRKGREAMSEAVRDRSAEALRRAVRG